MEDNLSKLNEIKSFIDKNSFLIYKYINEVVLKDIARINKNYFDNSINEIFFKEKVDNKDILKLNIERLPYEIFPFFLTNEKIDYTSLRIETIDFTLLNKEASVYYNYARFIVKEDFLSIDLMQTKIGGMPIDKDIVKFTKNIIIQNNGFEEYIKSIKF